jgi:hypothetical protein
VPLFLATLAIRQQSQTISFARGMPGVPWKVAAPA